MVTNQSPTKIDLSLYKMKNAGRIDLPTAAAQYAKVTKVMYDAGGVGAAAFPPNVYAEWAGLRDEVQTLFADVSDYLHRAGKAIVLCADDIAANDADAAANLRNAEDPNPPDGRDPLTYHLDPPKDTPPYRPENGGASDEDRRQDREDEKWTGDDSGNDSPWANKPVL